MILSQSQVQKLRAAGVPESTIAAFKVGTLNPTSGIGTKINNILSGSTTSGLSAGILPPGAAGGRSSYGTPRAAYSGPPARTGPFNPFQNLASTGFSRDNLGSGPAATPKYQTPKVTYNGPTTPGAFGPGIPNGPTNTFKNGIPNLGLGDEIANSGPADQAPGAGIFDGLTAPAAPVFPDINVPDLVVRDFLDPAKRAYAEAYAPLYEAVEVGKNNARGQQQNSDQVLAGLYSGLANDVKQAGQQEAAQYAASGQQAQATSQALQDRIGQIYGSSAQGTNDLAASLGQGQAAGELNANADTERRFQQAEAAKEGANQQDSYTQGAQAAQSYSGQVANAANTEGAGRRADLISQLSSILSQYDQQALGYKNQEAVGAIQQSNVLADRDMSQQQANINNILQTTGINDNRVTATYGAQQSAYQAALQQRQAEAEALASAQAAQAAAEQQRIDNSFKNREVSLSEVTAGAGSVDGYGNPIAGSSGGVKADGPTQVRQQAAAILQSRGSSEDPAEYEALVHGIQYGSAEDPYLPTAALGGKGDSGALTFDKNTFINEARRRAIDKGKDPEVAAAVADKYFDVYGAGA